MELHILCSVTNGTSHIIIETLKVSHGGQVVIKNLAQIKKRNNKKKAEFDNLTSRGIFNLTVAIYAKI